MSNLGPVYTKRQRQRRDNSAMILFSLKNNRAAPEWVCNPFSSDSIDFNENRIASVIARSSRDVDADAWCKRTLNN